MDASEAQVLRTGAPFGIVMYYEGEAPAEELPAPDQGYADCLPVIGGVCWRDPDSIDLAEALR